MTKQILLGVFFILLGGIYLFYLINTELKQGKKKIEEYWNLPRGLLGGVLLVIIGIYYLLKAFSIF